jgi:ABC-type transporter Mla MlaB component
LQKRDWYCDWYCEKVCKIDSAGLYLLAQTNTCYKWCYVRLSSAELPTVKMSTSVVSPSECRHINVP